MDSSGSGREPVVSCCEHCDEILDSKKGKEFFEQLSEYQLLEENFALRTLPIYEEVVEAEFNPEICHCLPEFLSMRLRELRCGSRISCVKLRDIFVSSDAAIHTHRFMLARGFARVTQGCLLPRIHRQCLVLQTGSGAVK
jgi:hypothetical protein